MGKSLNFIVGLSAGVAFMFGVSYLSGQRVVSGEPETQGAGESSSVPASESPFTVVASEPAVPVNPPAEFQSVSTFNEADITALILRIEEAETRIEFLEEEVVELQAGQFLPGDTLTEEDQEQQLSSVFEPATITEIELIRDQVQLQRLELRDQATREGYINTDRFRDEIRALNNSGRLRETLGDDDFDKLLLAEGRTNRVQIESVIENSAANLAGLEVGDTVISYADERIFNFRDLQGATTSGLRDEPVRIQVSRNDEIIDLVISRGPMGVTLSGVSDEVSP